MKKRMKIKQATVDAFAKKLKEWSKTLPKEERHLVRFLVARATAVNVGDLGGYDLKAKIRPDAEKLFKSLKKAIQSLPATGGVNLEPGDISWLRTTATTPDWKQATSVYPAAIRARGASR